MARCRGRWVKRRHRDEPVRWQPCRGRRAGAAGVACLLGRDSVEKGLMRKPAAAWRAEAPTVEERVGCRREGRRVLVSAALQARPVRGRGSSDCLAGSLSSQVFRAYRATCWFWGHRVSLAAELPVGRVLVRPWFSIRASPVHFGSSFEGR